MRTCSVEGCDKKHYAKDYCRKHWQWYKYYGGIKERTIFDPNEYYFCHGIVYIYLYNKKCEHITSATIDREDYDKVKDYKWCSDSDGYVVTYVNRKVIRLHRFLLDCPKDKVVDHINHNVLNNIRSNIRICTTQQNSMNNKAIGIAYDKCRNKWTAGITVDKKVIFLGRYDTEEEALKVRHKAEKKYFKEFANTKNNT